MASSWDKHVLALHSIFAGPPDRHCLLWVNPAQSDPFEGDLLVEERRFRVPIKHPRFDLRYAPYLVRLDLSRSKDSDVLARSVELACRAWSLDSLRNMNGQPICGWVAANGSSSELGHYWARTCHLHYRQGLAKLLRFHDPAVREWLWPSLELRQRQLMLGPAEKIFSISRTGELLTQGPANEAGIYGDRALPTDTLSLSERQWDEIENYAAVHVAWLGLCSANPECREVLSRKPDWHRAALDALHIAPSYGIRDLTDKALFARHALDIGSGFHLHPLLQLVWDKTRTGDFYGPALEEVIGDSADRLAFHLHEKV
ncbi:DUF4123 domain-containing protein [Herbaspirillum rubrisubalbicans]|uniref:DUF4123 domain-containing protein n=1 Tax=Herbaspirillum rubrisubalbicans TaxID=80842 RepID=UPI0015ECA5B8|nr:DUF4123 domain-containing protein [Herbaspirillum rubrisubalbicans]